MCFIKNVSRHLNSNDTAREDATKVLRLTQKGLEQRPVGLKEDPMFAQAKKAIQQEAMMPR